MDGWAWRLHHCSAYLAAMHRPRPVRMMSFLAAAIATYGAPRAYWLSPLGDDEIATTIQVAAGIDVPFQPGEERGAGLQGVARLQQYRRDAELRPRRLPAIGHGHGHAVPDQRPGTPLGPPMEGRTSRARRRAARSPGRAGRGGR